MTDSLCLEVRDLSASYGPVTALRDISIELGRGEAVAVLGANGAGKSTLLNTLSGLHGPAGGSVRVNGKELAGLPAADIARNGVALVPEGRQIFASLTVIDNLRLGAYANQRGRLRPDQLQAIFEAFPVLSDRQAQNAGTLSGGEQQMLAISRAIVAEPSLLLLDEPSMGLAPMIVESIFATLGEMVRASGISVLMVEQNVRAALGFATRGYLIDSGEIVAAGSSDDLSDEAIRAAYFGSARSH